MASSTELQADLKELENLSRTANRPRVREILQREVLRVKEQIKALEKVETAKKESQVLVNGDKVKEQKPKLYMTKITSYGWDQSDKFVKLYVTLEGVEKLPKENINADFSSSSVDLIVRELQSKNHQLQIRNLLHEINPKESSVKTKPGYLTILMRKAISKNWEYLTKIEKSESEKKKPNYDKDKDPSEGLMDMMKKLYEEGDDEMKRTIAKAWTESREKETSLPNL